MLELKNVSKTYRTKNGATHRALHNVSLQFGETGLVFIVGRSGGGKSTLLNMITALDRPDTGEMYLFGNGFSNFSSKDYDSYRNTYVGVIFQEYNLLPTLNVRQNIALALGLQHTENDDRVNAVIKKLGLEEIAERKVNQISGGQAQRVAIARAIVKDPMIIAADEPTGNLDSKTGREIFEVFKELSREKLVVIVTHDRDIADEIGDRVIEIKDGRVHKDLIRTSELYESAIDVVGDRLIRVPAGKKLDGIALEQINDILASSDRDTYIINEQDTQKVKSMNLHVKNAVDIQQENNATYYYPYRPAKEEKRDIKLIRSSMPFSFGAKLSFSMLKYKTFRLIMTILMIVLSLFISSVVGVFKYYDVDKATRKSIIADRLEFTAAEKNANFISDRIFSDEDISVIQKYSDSVLKVCTGNFVPKILNSDGRIPNDAERKLSKYAEEHGGDTEVPTMFRYFYGYVEISAPEDAGLELKYGSAPKSNSEVIISESVAQYFCDTLAFYPTEDVEKIVGKKISVSDRELTVTGIFASDIDNYFDVREHSREDSLFDGYYRYESDNRYIYDLTNRDGLLYVANGFMAELADTGSAEADVEFISGASPALTVLVKDIEKAPKLIASFDTGDKEGVYIDRTVFEEMFGDAAFMNESVTAFNEKTNPVTFSHVNGPSSAGTFTSIVLSDMKIAGVADSRDGSIYIKSADKQKFMSDEITVKKLIIKCGNTQSSVNALISALKDRGARINAYFTAEYDSFVSNLDLVSKYLTRVLIFICALAALLLYFFISASIKLEGRNIGILRGMGARGVDTFKAFGIEGALIAGISLLVTAVLIAVLFPALNSLISADYGYGFFVFIMNPQTVIILLITAALITAAAVIVPLIRLIRLMPVDTMNKNENQR